MAWSSSLLGSLIPRSFNLGKQVSAIGVGNKILFVGGWDWSSYDTIDIFDTQASTWSTQQLVSAYKNLSCTVRDGKALMYDSFNGYLYIYNPATDSLVKRDVRNLEENLVEGLDIALAATSAGGVLMPDKYGGVYYIDPSFLSEGDNSQIYAVPAGSGAIVGWCFGLSVGTNRVVFAGGINLNDDPSSVVEVWEDSGQGASLVQSSTLPNPRRYMSSIVVGNKVFFAGGYLDGPASYTNIVDIYDVVGNSWSSATLPVARGKMGVAKTGNKIHFAGGFTDGEIPSSVVDVYDADANSWSTSSISEARGELAGAFTSDGSNYFAVFAGGYDGLSSYSMTADIYSQAAAPSFPTDVTGATTLNPTSGSDIVFPNDVSVDAGGDLTLNVTKVGNLKGDKIIAVAAGGQIGLTGGRKITVKAETLYQLLANH